jgi:uncharacterized lipoprotein YddW (UPF0748 family)
MAHRSRVQLAVLLAVAVLVTVGIARWQTRPGAAPQSAAVTSTCAGQPLTAARQLRGMWLTTVSNIDWPSRPGLPEEQVKKEYREWLDLAQRRGHNAVFVHVRPAGDAFWQSDYAPWSYYLTGRRDGQAPGWDPMAFMITEAHARNLEFHAWFNPYKASQTGVFAELPQSHPLRAHPEWAVAYPAKGKGSRLYYNPGIPEARKFVEDSILDAVNRYDIDGVHFDDFFYPYPSGREDFNDAATFKAQGRGINNKADWRRDNVNLLVRETNERIKAAKPWVKFGISPFGIWRNASSDPLGSPTRGLQSYDAIYADTRRWVQERWVDYIVPQLYWHIGFAIADYAKLLPWWSDLVANSPVQLYVGQADYRVGQKGAWRDPAQLDRQLALNRRYRVTGSVHFSARQVKADRLGAVSRYAAAHYSEPALVPAMSHLPEKRPPAPEVEADRVDEGVRLSWEGEATSYAVYRLDGEAARLVATTRGTTWVDTAKDEAARTYCVTGLDRLWNEGSPSEPRVVS